jgi:hypothetical protein
MMAAKHKVIVSTRPTNSRGSTADRRAAQVALLSTRQAELKQEAAERRAQRALQDPQAPSAPGKAPASKPADSR